MALLHNAQVDCLVLNQGEEMCERFDGRTGKGGTAGSYNGFTVALCHHSCY